jgi:hypothetical protein
MFPEKYCANPNIGPIKYRFQLSIFQINYSIDNIYYLLLHGLNRRCPLLSRLGDGQQLSGQDRLLRDLPRDPGGHDLHARRDAGRRRGEGVRDQEAAHVRHDVLLVVVQRGGRTNRPHSGRAKSVCEPG